MSVPMKVIGGHIYTHIFAKMMAQTSDAIKHRQPIFKVQCRKAYLHKKHRPVPPARMLRQLGFARCFKRKRVQNEISQQEIAR